MFRPDNKVYLKGDKKMTKKHYIQIAKKFNELLKKTEKYQIYRPEYGHQFMA